MDVTRLLAAGRYRDIAEYSIRAEAAHALGEIKSESADVSAALRKALSDDFPGVRKSAADALRKISASSRAE